MQKRGARTDTAFDSIENASPMYGLVNKAVEQLVTEQFGDEQWRRIRERAEVDTTFVAMSSYPDEVTYRLVEAASEVLGAPPEQILEAFGEHWIRYTVDEGYGDMMALYGDTVFEFLNNMNSLHAQIRLTFPELKPPVITCEALPGGDIEVAYRSDRPGLAPMLVGLIRGLGKRFGTPVEIERLPAADDDGVELFRVTHVGRQAA